MVAYWQALSEGWQIFWTGTGITILGGLFAWSKGWLKRKKLAPPEETPNLPQPEPAPKPGLPKSEPVVLKTTEYRLPVTDTKLFGRKDELTILNTAWAADHTNIVTLIAMGGAGKTALLNTFLDGLGKDYGGAERVFVWSFYRQGASGETQASADLFFEKALEWFGHTEKIPESAYDKGVKLAEYVRSYKTLLVLDGLEPLQHPPGPMHGALKDQGLEALITQLAGHNPGMLLISSRVEVHEISGKTEPTVIQHELGNLKPEAGAQFLKSLKVTGSAEELEKAVKEFGGHALALKLLGSWLGLQGGDIAKRDTIPSLLDYPDDGGHAMRVMAAYETQLAGTADLAGLFINGLFDRPAPPGAIAALRAEPVIKGLTDNLADLKPGQWQAALAHLRELGLLNRSDNDGDTTLDAHPLVREYFGARLQELGKAEYTEAHTRLYAYYKDSAEGLPATLGEMEPLFAAIAHGCAAGKHQEVFDDVYYKRVMRGKTNFLCDQLGGFGADLAVLSYFFDKSGDFEKSWQTPVKSLSAPDQSFVLSAAGYRLRALGRLREAVNPIQAGLSMVISQKDWQNAAIAAGNLSELYLTLGDVQSAVALAQDSVKFADDSEDEFQMMAVRTTHADALHQAGQGEQAMALFEQAETMQVEQQKHYPLLYSLQGYQYCDLLLSRGQYGDVKTRAGQTLAWAKANKAQLLDIALDTLSLGRAELARILDEKTGDFTSAAQYLDEAVEGLRTAGTLHHIPRGHLARAACFRHRKMFDEAEADLVKVFDISTRCEMRLHLTDAHLEAAHLARAAAKDICGHDADFHIEQAAKLIADTGYDRRKPELAALQAG